VPASEADAQLSVAMREANAIAKAGDAVPKGYRGNPGAVLLARAWAENRGLDILTAVQSVAFVQGRPVIDATMQRALAKQAGYRVLVTEADANYATVKVTELSTGEVIGEASYTMADAKAAGLIGKDNWKKNPEDMLVARATTRAVRRYAPEVMVGLTVAEEFDEIAPDPVAVLDSHAGEDQNPETVDVAHNPVGESEEPSAATAAPESSPADIEDAEIVDDQPITDPTRGRVLDAMREAKKRDDWGQVAQEMQAEGIQMVASKMTEAEGQLVLGILGSGE
jgi:hypothetical protein